MIIKVENNISTLVEYTGDEWEWVYDYLTIHEPKFRKNYRTKRTEHMGTIPHRLLNRSKMTFPAGFTFMVHHAAKREGINISYVDARQECEVKPIDVDISYLRDYQREALEVILKRKRGIIKHCTGSGKSIVAIALIQKVPIHWLFLCQSKDLLRQFANKYTQFTGEEEVSIIGDSEVTLLENSKLTIATAQTINSRITDKQIQNIIYTTPGLIIEECFPAGTIITCKKMLVENKRIEVIKKGDEVLSYDTKKHEFVYKKVIRTFKSKPRSLIRIKLSNGKEIICTPNHPFLTENGWKKAIDCGSDTVLYIENDQKTENINILQPLQQTIYPKCRSNSESKEEQNKNILHLEMLSKIQKHHHNKSILRKLWDTVQAIKDNWSILYKNLCACVENRPSKKNRNIHGTDIFRKNDQKQSNKNARCKRKSNGISQDKGKLETSDTRRKRQRPDSSRNSTNNSTRMGMECYSSDKKTKKNWIPFILSNRCSKQRLKNSNRSRRKLTQNDIETKKRRKERCFPTRVRVDSIEVLKQTSDGKFAGMCPDSYAYNLEVEKTHTYIANNCVVHNCHGAAADTMFRVALRAKNAYYKVGLSVGPNTYILTKNKSIIKHTTIKELAEKYKASPFANVQKYDIYVRAYKNNKFTWAKLNKIFTHKSKSKCLKIKTAYGRNILITKDHSIYKVEKSKSRYEITGLGKKPTTCTQAKYLPKVICVKGDNLNIDDYVLVENKLEVEDKIPNKTNIYEMVKHKHDYIVKGTKFGLERGRRTYINKHVTTKELAYVLGYYIGNGWIDGGRVCFSVKNTYLETFLERLHNFTNQIEAKPKIREMPSKATEVRTSSYVFVDIIKCLNLNKRSYKKRIPQIAWHFDNESLDCFIEGLKKSDGHRSKNSRGRERIIYTTTSPELAYDLVELLKLKNITAGLNKSKNKNKGGIINGRQIIGKQKYKYTVGWSPLKQEGHKGSGRLPWCFLPNIVEGLPVKVKKIEEVESPEFVYDLEVEDCNNFLGNGILVHNSATPKGRTDHKNMYIIGAIGPVIHEVTADELIKAGYISKPKIEMHVCEQECSAPNYQGAYGQLVVRSTKRNKLVVELMKKATYPNLTFVKQKNHGRELQKRAEKAGINVEFMWGGKNTKQRQAALKRLVRGDIDSIICTVIFTQGIDIPELRSIVVAAAGKSEIQTLQRLGRGSRTTENKQTFELFDILDRKNKWTQNHANKRLKAYRTEKYDVKII